MWFLLLTAVAAGNFEVTGWAPRTYSHFPPDKLMPYLIQTVSTINGPTPLIAAYFIILAEVIRRLGPCYSRLKPRMCMSLGAIVSELKLMLNPQTPSPS